MYKIVPENQGRVSELTGQYKNQNAIDGNSQSMYQQ
jgi:hypothetical protein